MRTPEEIVYLWHYRRDRSEEVRNRMRKVRDAYNGDLVLPFTDDTEPAVANLVLTGIDQKAGRIASVMPQIWFPPTSPGVRKSETAAQNRRDTVLGWWEDNRIEAMLRTRARYLIAYGTAPVIIYPDISRGVPTWKLRNPLACFPSTDLAAPLTPADMICAVNKSWGWFRRNYPEIAFDYAGLKDLDDSMQVTLLEYVDDTEYHMVFAGIDPIWYPGMETIQFDTNQYTADPRTCIKIENRTGHALAVVPERPNLDRIQGEFDQMIGIYGAQAKLTALELAAVERDVFPDTYLVSRPGEVAEFIRGPFDGRTGEVNVVRGGEVQNLTSSPGYQTTPMIDRLERAQRLIAGVPAEFGGESTSNIRTGRRGDSVLSAVIDYPIKEAQDSFAEALEMENRLAIKVARAYWGSRKVALHFTDKGRLKTSAHTPDEVFTETDYHKVTYPVAGADMNQLVVGMGQRIGLGILSKRSAAELDPLVADPELEADRITAEALEMAMLSGIQNQAAEGAIPPEVVGRVMELIKSDKLELPAALAKATEEYQADQAPIAPVPTGMEQQMAMATAQATGEPQGLPPVAEAGQGIQNLAGLMNALRKTNTRSAGRTALGGSA